MGSGLGGPAQFGQSPSVSNPDYINNPSQYQAFNFTPAMNAATANVNQNIANQQRNAQANATAGGAGRSAGNSRAQRDIAATGQNQVNQMNLGAAENAFNQQLAQQNAQNQFNLGAQQNALAKYKAENENYLNEQKLRRESVGQLPGGKFINIFGGNY